MPSREGLREIGVYVVGLETGSKDDTIALGPLLYPSSCNIHPMTRTSQENLHANSVHLREYTRVGVAVVYITDVFFGRHQSGISKKLAQINS